MIDTTMREQHIYNASDAMSVMTYDLRRVVARSVPLPKPCRALFGSGAQVLIYLMRATFIIHFLLGLFVPWPLKMT